MLEIIHRPNHRWPCNPARNVRRFSGLVFAVILAGSGVAPLPAQSHGTLQYIDHQILDAPVHGTVLSTNIAFTNSYFDSEGNILPLQRNFLGMPQPFYLFTEDQIFYYNYDSQELNTRFPLDIPFGNDVTPSSTSEVSYDARIRPDPNVPLQRAVISAPRNSLFFYNITSRTRLNTITLRNEPTEPLLQPMNALVVGFEGIFTTNNGNIYLLSDEKLSVSNGELSPLVTAQGSGPGELNNPSALNLGPDGLLYVLDAGNHRIQKFEPTTGIYRGGFNLPEGLSVYSPATYVIGGGDPVFDADGNDIYANTSGYVFPTSLAISYEGHIYLGDGAGGGFVLNLEGELLSTFHPPNEEDEPSGRKAAVPGSFLTYDGYGTIFTYVDGVGLHMYRDPTYPIRYYPSTSVLELESDRTLGEAETSTLTLNFHNGANLTIADTLNLESGYIYMFGDGSIEPGGTLAAAGDVIKGGQGTLTLENENTYTGTTIVLAGTLLVNGSIAGDAIVRDETTLGGSGVIDGNVMVDDGGILSPGNSPGLLTIQGDLTLSEESTLLMEIGGTAEGLFDQLAVEGVFLADGTLNLQLVDGYVPDAGDSFLLFTEGGFASGNFTQVLTNLGGDLTWDTSQLGSTGRITAVPEPSTWALLGLGLVAMGAFHRRSRGSLPRF